MSSETSIVAQKATKITINVPDGLRPLLESLAREVIRNQPLDIYAFAFLFADNLVKTRQENGGVDPISMPALYDKFKNNLSAEAIAKGLRGQHVVMTVSEQALTDERKVRRRRVGADAAPPTPDRAAATIQAAARGFVARRRVRRTRRDLEAARDARVFADDAYDVRRRPRRRRRTGREVNGVVMETPAGEKKAVPAAATLNNNDVTKTNLAATKIQANVRGFLTRRKLSPASREHKSAVEKTGGNVVEQSEPLTQLIGNQQAPSTVQQSFQVHLVEPVIKLEDVDASASKIQAGIRGYLTRKHLAEKGLPVHAPAYQRSRSHSPNVSQPQGNPALANKNELKWPKMSPGGSQSCDDLLKTIYSDQKRVDDAACKIQAGVRGFLTRKHLHEKGIPVHHTPHEIHQLHQELKKEVGETSM